jgi:hypothetical protein
VTSWPTISTVVPKHSGNFSFTIYLLKLQWISEVGNLDIFLKLITWEFRLAVWQTHLTHIRGISIPSKLNQCIILSKHTYNTQYWLDKMQI